MSTVNGFQVGSETLKYNYESLDNYNTPNFSTSSSETYAVGDYVMYNGKLYKCTTATTGGTWVSGNWTEAVLSDDVSGLTRQLSDLDTSVKYGVNQLFADLSTWERGYVNASGVLVSNPRTISPTDSPIKLDTGKTVRVDCGTLTGGYGLYRYDSDTQTYSRYINGTKTGVFELQSDGDNYYYSLSFQTNPVETITPSVFDGFIGLYTDWMDKIQTSLQDDGLIPVYTDLTQWSQGYFNSRGNRASSSNRCTPLSSPILLYAGDIITIDPAGLSCGLSLYDYNSGVYTRQSSITIITKTTITYAVDQYIAFDFGKDPTAATAPSDFTGEIKASVPWKTQIYHNTSRIAVLETAAASGNYLAGKKLVACGDSITAAVNPQGGNFDSYARLAAQRNGMVFDLNAVSGSTMTNVTGKNPFCVDRYQQVPSDFDYLTIWFGFNDGAYAQVGTIEDTEDTTFYGAYKKVMDYFLTTYPTKKIGLVVPYMSDTAFQQAVRDISNMYGVPCLDLPNYNQCSVVWGSANTAQAARTSALTYDGTHPNQTGHEFISTMYEQFLRRL